MNYYTKLCGGVKSEIIFSFINIFPLSHIFKVHLSSLNVFPDVDLFGRKLSAKVQLEIRNHSQPWEE